MTSKAGIQTITINIWSDISKSKDNQTMKFGQLIEHNVKNIFLQKSCRKRGRETSSKPLLFYKEALYEVKAMSWHLSFDIFW